MWLLAPQKKGEIVQMDKKDERKLPSWKLVRQENGRTVGEFGKRGVPGAVVQYEQA